MSGASGAAYFSANPFHFDQNGVPLAGGQLFFYESGTTTPLNTYQDPALTIPNANPVVANAGGYFGPIWLSPSQPYKVQLFTAATPNNPTGSEIWSIDPFGPAAAGAIANNAGIVGESRDFCGPAASVPTGWYLCYGQAVSRTTYAALFAVIGTTWGAGDASTTFNLPDFRGRGTLGKDDMGGSAAGRITSGVSGISGTTLGASGGDQNAQEDTLTADTTTTVDITDPGHFHTYDAGQSTGAASTPLNYIFGNQAAVAQNGNSQTTGITATATSTTTVTSGNTGESGNVQPSAVVNKIIYAGA